MTETEKHSNDGAEFVKELRESFIKIRLRAKGVVNRIRNSALFTCFIEYSDKRFSELIESETVNTDVFLEELKNTREAALALVDSIDELAEEILSRA